MSLRRLLALLTFVAAAVAPARAAQFAEPIANFEAMPVKTLGAKPSAAQVRDAIVRAGQSRNWTFADGEPGQLIATLSVRDKHTAVVTIAYTPEIFSVTYRKSVNLKYRPDGTIHPSYNKWVAELVNGINVALFRIEGAGGAPTPPAAAARPRPVSAPASGSTEVSFWESVRNSQDPAEFQAYLDAFPNGIFAPLARARLAALKK